MRLSSQEHIVPGGNLRERADYLRGHGFDAIELTLSERGTRQGSMRGRIPEIRDIMAASGITVSIISSNAGSLLDPDMAARQTAMAQIREALEVAAAVGARGAHVVPHIGPIGLPDLSPLKTPWELGFELCARELSALGAHAERHGVALILEPLNRYLTKFLNTADQAIWLCRESGQSSVRMLIDNYQANIEEISVVGAIERAGQHLAHVHIAEHNRRLPPQGTTDFVPIIVALRKIDYRGYLSFECDPVPGDQRAQFDAAVLAIKNAVASSQAK